MILVFGIALGSLVVDSQEDQLNLLVLLLELLSDVSEVDQLSVTI